MSHTMSIEIPRSRLAQGLYEALEALSTGKRLSDEEREVIYALAYAHVVQGQFTQALPIFSMLTLYGPTKRHYLAGLALCLEMAGRYEEAIEMYSLLGMLFPGTLEPALQVAECQVMLGRFGDAVQELQRVLLCMDESPGQYELLRPRAQLLMDLAQKQEVA